MPLTPVSLSSKIKTQLEAVYGSPVDDKKLQDFCDAIAKAVIEEILTNAVIGTPLGPGTIT